MYLLSDLRSFVYRDLGMSSTDNDRLPTATIDTELNRGYKEVALLTRCFKRTASVAAVTTQALYALPLDVFDIDDISYNAYTARLLKTSRDTLEYNTPTWRSTAAGTSTHWYWQDSRNFGLYPPPSFTGTNTIYVDGFIVPYSAGAGISTAVRATNVVTITTNRAHGLIATNVVNVRGVTDSTFDKESATVATAPTTTTFTYAQTAGDASSTGGTVSMTSGNYVAPLTLAADMPEFSGTFHIILVHFAVWQLASRYIFDTEEAGHRAEVAKAAFDELIERMRWNV